MVRKECIGQISDHEVIVTFASKDATRGRQLQLDYYQLSQACGYPLSFFRIHLFLRW